MENKKIKVLAIDDNRDNLITIKAILSEQIPQSAVYTETSGKAGIELAAEVLPDVILLDIVMPGMDGYQVCKTFKADERLSEIPVIFLTALGGDKQSHIDALEAGGEAFLAKPIDAPVLKAQVLAMFKIREAAAYKRDEKLRLEQLVQERTRKLNEQLRLNLEINSKLSESEEKYRYLFANNPLPMWVYDLQSLAFLEANQTAVSIYGYTRDEFLGMTLKDIRPAEDVELLLDDVANTTNTYNNAGIWRHKKKNGEIIFVEINSYAIQFQSKKSRLVVANDVTKRVKAEKQVQTLGQAVEQSPATIVITNPKGIIEYVNTKFTQITGYSPDEAIGKTPRIFKSGRQSEAFYKELWETISAGKVWNGEMLNKKKNGELYWESASIAPIISSNGEIINYVAVKEDITERKKIMEELVVAKEKAEESDRLKSAFLANMSHEIRTPMNGILGFTNLLLEPDLSSDKKESFIEIIHQSGQRMLNTVTDIIEISKIEAGLVHVNVKETDFNNRIEELYHFFQPEAERKGLKLILEKILPAGKNIISTDKNKLDSILTNLIKNAIKYTESGTIKIACQLKNSVVEFYVEDTGIGIPKHRQEAIFNRFEQADIADTRVFEGSGLGLAISKSYVEMLGGKIWVESEEKKGSTFHFTLPAKIIQKKKSRH